MARSTAEAAAEPREDAVPAAFAGRPPRERGELLGAPVRYPRPSLLEAPLSALAGAGPKLAEVAAAAGLETVGDVLRHVPHSHRDRAGLRALADLRTGEEATVLAEVRSARLRPTRRRGLTIVEATVADSSGSAKAIWFNQRWLVERLAAGTPVLLHGTLDRRGFRVADHEILGPVDAEAEARPRIGAPAPPGIHTTGLVPVHPATEGLRPQRLREWAWQAGAVATEEVEPLPAELRTRRRLPAVGDALRAVHFPRDAGEAALARRRLAFEELLLYQVALAARRGERRERRDAAPLGDGELARRWLAALPFEPTADQRRACAEIDADLRSPRPMQRLLMGEVGSGKTLVALWAMLRAVEAGRQAALMAPTETLAEQHARTLDRLLAAEPVAFALLTGATPAAARRRALERLATGELALVVGTHALLEPEVGFARLALCVIDEQHRFGVRQRATLDAKGPGGLVPHALHMTATPIPRTLSLTAYGDLDSTVLRELPAGRRPVKTWWVGEERRGGAYEFLRERLREGRQAFVVCPLVAESEKLQARAATEEARRLAEGELRGFEVDVLHGQMPAARKSEAMERFAAGASDVLVATSVIEVGIDVPNATVMVIEDADRYGVSQLHQLRGRVGRGEHESFCLLFADEPGAMARRRLEAVAAESDGFELAEVDLALRGEGEILGTRQHGLPRFRVARLPDDGLLLLEAREEALALARRHGSFAHPALGPLLQTAQARFGADPDAPIPA